MTSAEATEAELQRRWRDLTSFVDEEVRERWWSLVRERYARRAFYNFAHLLHEFEQDVRIHQAQQDQH